MKQAKNYTINPFILALLLILLSLSCNDKLDLYPENSISESSFWKSEKDLTAGVNAVYQSLHSLNTKEGKTFEAFGMLDAITEIAAARSVSPWNAQSSGVVEANNWIATLKWRDCYRGIIRANDVIVNIDGINADESVKNERLGEVYFLRSWFYFNLVYLFGDVPLILDVPTLDESQIARTPRDEVIDQMLTDLDNAIGLLPASPSETGRVTQGAAYTLKAKIYMQDSNYSLAIPNLEAVMGMNYSLYDDYRKLFLVEAENNSEVIFDIQFISQTGMDQGNSFQTLYGNKSTKSPGWSWLLPTKELIELYETKADGLPDSNPLFDKKDPRMDMTVIRPGATFIDKDDVQRNYYEGVLNYEHAQTGMHCRKFIIEGSSPENPYEGYWDAPQNWIFFRYADVLLLYAEAMNEVYGPSTQIYNALNTIRQRPTVNMPKIENKTQDELREIIHRERGVELALEGWRFFDLLRWGELQSVNDGFEVVHVLTDNPYMTRIFQDRNLLWPIPQQEMDSNAKLIQNPGY